LLETVFVAKVEEGATDSSLSLRRSLKSLSSLRYSGDIRIDLSSLADALAAIWKACRMDHNKAVSSMQAPSSAS